MRSLPGRAPGRLGPPMAFICANLTSKVARIRHSRAIASRVAIACRSATSPVAVATASFPSAPGGVGTAPFMLRNPRPKSRRWPGRRAACSGWRWGSAPRLAASMPDQLQWQTTKQDTFLVCVAVGESGCSSGISTSPSLRQFHDLRKDTHVANRRAMPMAHVLWWPRRSLATLDRKSRQGRKAATVSIDAGAEVNRRGHHPNFRQCQAN